MKNIDGSTAPPFQYFFRVDVGMLRFIGLSSFSTVFTTGEFKSSWRQFPFIFIGSMTIIAVLLCHIHKIVWGKNDMSSILETSLHMATQILGVLRGVRSLTHQRVLYKILRRLSTLWGTALSNNFLTTEHLKAASNVKLMRSIYTVTIVGLSGSYILRPYIALLDHQLHRGPDDSFNYTTFILADKYAFTIESLQGYFAFIIFEQIAIHFIAIFWVSTDTMFAQLMTHVSIQFNILAYNLENVNKDDDAEDSNDVTQRLRDIAKQHEQLFIYCHLIETLYNPTIFLIVVSHAANTCCSLYTMEAQLSERNWNEISKSLLFLVVLSLQTVLYCGYADTLTQSSMRIFYACTNSQWTSLNKRNKKILSIIMMRAQKEYRYTVYGMIALNLNRLTTIANGSISYFMLLRNFG